MVAVLPQGDEWEVGDFGIKVPKIYIVNINGKLSPEEGEKMFNGIEIETDTGEKKLAYAQVLPIELTNKSSTLQYNALASLYIVCT